MPRAPTPSFVAEFPLRTSAADETALAKRLDAQCKVYNACLGEALRRLKLMRESRDWQRARRMPRTLGKDASGKPIPNTARTELFKAVLVRFSFTSASIQRFAEGCRDACWIGDHAGSHDTQTTSLRAFKAVQMHAFGKRGRPRFKPASRFSSVEGKGDAVIRFRPVPVPAIYWNGLVLPLFLDRKDRRGWQAQALACRTKYTRIVRRVVKGRTRWFCQLVQEGLAPQVHETAVGIVGLDIGPSTIAAVSVDASEAVLERLCPEVVQPWKATRRIQRSMDRSRRATNPDRFNPDGTARKGSGKWVRSVRYLLRQEELAEIERVLASRRKQSHGGFANRVLAMGTTVHAEEVSYRSFQKSFGRSVRVRAPGMQMAIIRRKAESAGGGMVDIATRTTRLSQYDHSTGDSVRKPLSQRIHVFGDGVTAPVQRDLYSAFLATCCDTDTLDVLRVERTWPAAEPLLRRAMSGDRQPASGKGVARPHARKGVGAGRPSKGDGRPCEATDVVARARAMDSRNAGTPRTPRL